jgi:hypothetical protein
MRSWIFPAVSLLLLNGCFGSRAPQGQTNMPRKATYFNNNGLTLKSATLQDSVSVLNGQRNIEYFFKVSIVTSEQVSFDSVWIGQKPLHIYITEENKTITSGKFKIALGSTITFRASDFNTQQIPSDSRAPVAYEGKALIRYSLAGQTYYLVAKEIQPVAISKKP